MSPISLMAQDKRGWEAKKGQPLGGREVSKVFGNFMGVGGQNLVAKS